MFRRASCGACGLDGIKLEILVGEIVMKVGFVNSFQGLGDARG